MNAGITGYTWAKREKTKQLLEEVAAMPGGKIKAWIPFNCEVCGKETVRVGRFQKYCRPCSAIKSEERKHAHYKEKWKDGGYRARSAAAAKRSAKTLNDTYLPKAGVMRSTKASIGDPFVAPELAWVCRIVVPFTHAASKNHVYGVAGGGHLFKRQSVREFQEAVTALAICAMRETHVKPIQNKLWIALHVEKANHKSDAINVIDSVADGLKKAIGIDDRWFAIRQLDWTISKSAPQIIIEFGQEADVPRQACACCGQILPFEEFASSGSHKAGVRRICNGCISEGRRLMREAKEAA